MNIFEKLSKIQNELKVTKDQPNDFGGFKYRSAEKIFEESKPICKEYGCVLRVTDEIIEVAGKPYVKAVAELIDVEMQGEIYAISAVGNARIPDNRKGMDDCQISGSASSYARKYAMCGLFCIDDNKDSDVPPALPDNREDFERYADNYYGKREKTKNRSDEQENWRLVGNEVQVRTKQGWKNLEKLELRWLEVMLNDSRFEGIESFVQSRINELKGKK